MRINRELLGVWIIVYALGISAWWAFFKFAAWFIRSIIGG